MIENKKINTYLIDIQYDGTMNDFYEFYRESTNYSEIEQESYLDLKHMVFEKISSNIKFRKHSRDGMILTLRVEMEKRDYEKFIYLWKKNKFRFLHPYKISGAKLMDEEIF